MPLPHSAIASNRELLSFTNSKKAIEKDVASEKSDKELSPIPKQATFG